MNKKELKAALSNFNMTAGAQLKYYIIKSLYPDIKASEIEAIGGFNSRTFPAIRTGVEEKGLELLSFTASEEAEVTETESAELVELREENEELRGAIQRREYAIKLMEQTINSNTNKIASLKEFIQKIAKSRETVIECYRQAIEQLQDQGIEVVATPFGSYGKEMTELLK